MVKNNPLSNIKLENIKEWMGIFWNKLCKCNPFNSFITAKIHLIPLQSWSWACLTNTPLELKKWLPWCTLFSSPTPGFLTKAMGDLDTFFQFMWKEKMMFGSSSDNNLSIEVAIALIKYTMIWCCYSKRVCKLKKSNHSRHPLDDIQWWQEM